MSDTRFTVFDTAIGSAGLAWSARGIAGTELPDPDGSRVRARLRRRFPGAVESSASPAVEAAIAAIRELLAGQAADLGKVELDMRGVPEFDCQVYAAARRIGAGETSTYGQIARQLGDVHLARDVGRALARNPFPIVVPCHRILGAGARLGGFSARGGVATKQRLLELERAEAAWQMPLVPRLPPAVEGG